MRCLKFILPILAALSSAVAGAEERYTLFEDVYARPGVAEKFVAGSSWFPFPEYADREAWHGYFAVDSAFVVRRAERYLDYRWQTIPASAYLAFERTGDRSAMERPEGDNRSALISVIFAELAEGKGRFLDAIMDFSWAAAQEPSWMLSAHQIRQNSGRSLPDDREHFIDLASGRLGAILSVSWYFFHEEFDAVDPSISYAILAALKKQIFDPYLDDGVNVQNWWSGLANTGHVINNWNPWCNSDVILSFLLAGQDQEMLSAALQRAVLSLDLYMDNICSDGACDEGPIYWENSAGKVLDFINILYDASGGAFDVYSDERIRSMGEFVSRCYYRNGYTANFADAAPKLPDMSVTSYRFGKAFGSDELLNFGLYQLADAQIGSFKYPKIITGDIYRTLSAIKASRDIRADVDRLNREVAASSFEEVRESLRNCVPASIWYPETELCYMRNGSDWFFAAKGGHNGESHNHNDVGTFVLYVRGVPVFVDAGVGTYTRDTFDEGRRYSIWTMVSPWHNLPSPNGAEQKHTKQFRSGNVSCSPSAGTFSLDLAGAYPEDSGILSWRRSYFFSPKGRPSLRISDARSLSERNSADEERFLVKGEVVLPGNVWNGRKVRDGELLILCGEDLVMKMTYPASLSVRVEEKKLEDPVLVRNWGPVLRRISFSSADNAPLKGKYEFIISEIR